jgi:hypothetical protein
MLNLDLEKKKKRKRREGGNKKGRKEGRQAGKGGLFVGVPIKGTGKGERDEGMNMVKVLHMHV